MGTNVTSAGNPGDGRPVSQDVTPNFETFYHGTSPRLLRFAYGLTGDMAQAEDFTQEAYTRAWQRWKRLQTYDNPESWLRLVVTRLATDRWRWLGKRREAAKPRAEVVPGPNENLTDLAAELKRLPMEQRRALVLHYFLDQPVAVIAKETGANINTVKSWLARGRANLAAQLEQEIPDPLLPNAQHIAKQASRRKLKTVAKTIAAFLATASAAASFLLFGSSATQPPVNPGPVIPYGTPAQGQPEVVADEHRAYTLWRDTKQQTWLSAIDLGSDRQAWTPVNLGSSIGAARLAGVAGGAVIVEGGLDLQEPGRGAVLAIAADSGQKLWQREPALGHGWLRIEAGVVIVSGIQNMEALDPQTGNARWQAPAQFVGVDGDRLATYFEDRLQVRDLGTGAIRNERAVRNGFMGEGFLDGDWLYYGQFETLERISVTGSAPPVPLAAGFGAGLARCGDQLCALRDREVVCLDRATGDVLWHRPAGPGILEASEGGVIVKKHGATGTGADPFQLIVYDVAGNDITPANLSTRDAAWVDSEHLVMRARYEDAQSQPGQSLNLLDLTVISVRTGQESLLGRRALMGACLSVQRRYICPEKDGFVVHHY
jgi:RNA polymerase sigma-70 factor (sigma-E family)